MDLIAPANAFEKKLSRLSLKSTRPFRTGINALLKLLKFGPVLLCNLMKKRVNGRFALSIDGLLASSVIINPARGKCHEHSRFGADGASEFDGVQLIVFQFDS